MIQNHFSTALPFSLLIKPFSSVVVLRLQREHEIIQTARVCICKLQVGAREERKSFVSPLPLRDESECWPRLKLLG